MSEALEGVSKLYIDANILIYLVEESKIFNESVIVALREAQTRRIRIFTNEISVTECLNGAYRSGFQSLARRYLDMFNDKGFLSLIPIHFTICLEGARIAAETRLKTIDALHLASATHAGCDAFLTNDARFRSNEDIRVLQLSQFLANN
jgi:predicted nucleic acid-binding protein